MAMVLMPNFFVIRLQHWNVTMAGVLMPISLCDEVATLKFYDFRGTYAQFFCDYVATLKFYDGRGTYAQFFF